MTHPNSLACKTTFDKSCVVTFEYTEHCCFVVLDCLFGSPLFHEVRETIASVGGVPTSQLNRFKVKTEASKTLIQILSDSRVTTKTASNSSEPKEASLPALEHQKTNENSFRLSLEQQRGVNWLRSKDVALLADSVGFGKTAQLLVAAPENYDLLIITTTSSKGQWHSEIQTWRPDLTSGATINRVISWDSISSIQTVNTKTVLVADEAHKLKNRKTTRHREFKRLAELVRRQHGKVWLATATPLVNSPQDLWNVLMACGAAELTFGSWLRFVDLFGGEKLNYGYSWRNTSKQASVYLDRILLKRSAVFCDVHRSAVLVSVEGALQRELDSNLELLGQMLTKATNGVPSDYAFGNLVEFNKVRQKVCSHKFATVEKLVKEYEDANEPVVVFCSFLGPVLALSRRTGWARISGDVPERIRRKTVEDFQNGLYKGLAIVSEAGGEAITLTRSNVCIFIDLPWSPARLEQCEGRIIRRSQTRTVTVVYVLLKHVFDRRVVEILYSKSNLAEVLNAKQSQ